MIRGPLICEVVDTALRYYPTGPLREGARERIIAEATERAQASGFFKNVIIDAVTTAIHNEIDSLKRSPDDGMGLRQGQ
jgi:hypothetical protein